MLSSILRARKGHAGWGGLTHEVDFFGGEAVGLVDEARDAVL